MDEALCYPVKNKQQRKTTNLFHRDKRLVEHLYEEEVDGSVDTFEVLCLLDFRYEQAELCLQYIHLKKIEKPLKTSSGRASS